MESSKDNLKDIYKQFGILLTVTLIIAAFAGLISASIIYSLIWFLITLVVLDFKAIEEPCIHKFFKVIIGMLPFNNRYSFVKTIRELEKLEKEYNKFSKQYEDYLKYLNNEKKLKAVEETKEVIEGNFRTIADIEEELLSKVKSLTLEEEREKYLELLAKLAEFYTREKERIALKNGNNHSEEDRNLDMSVLKQLTYIEMQINSSIYKNVDLLSEDCISTLDNAKGKKLERTLGLGK